jgi:hypothetical protein
MTTGLIQIDVSTWVRHGTARAEWKKHKGRELLVVSAEMPDGKRRDIDSSLCPFLCAGLLETINRSAAFAN